MSEQILLYIVELVPRRPFQDAFGDFDQRHVLGDFEIWQRALYSATCLTRVLPSDKDAFAAAAGCLVRYERPKSPVAVFFR